MLIPLRKEGNDIGISCSKQNWTSEAFHDHIYQESTLLSHSLSRDIHFSF